MSERSRDPRTSVTVDEVMALGEDFVVGRSTWWLLCARSRLAALPRPTRAHRRRARVIDDQLRAREVLTDEAVT